MSLEQPGTTSLAAWFLGPKAENEGLLRELIEKAIAVHGDDRRAYYPADPIYVTNEIKKSPDYQSSVRVLRDQFAALLERLRGSTPFWSYRWQSHMNWDTTLPGMAAYFAALLYNPNNVAAEASPVTTPLEMQVGDDLCKMLGYAVPASESGGASGSIRPWGHITCDGSVANLEAMWASRNLKYYPVSMAEALKNEPTLKPAQDLEIPLLDGGRARLADLDTWTLLNLKADDTLAVPTRVQDEYSISTETLTQVLDDYTLQSLGFMEFQRRFLKDCGEPPAIMAPATMHYSWPKSAAILGIGKNNVEAVRVDFDARMDLAHLRARLDACLAARRAVLMTVVVLGSTEESAVDPLAQVLALREHYRKAGLEFTIHVDAAWGGYFAAILRAEPSEKPGAERQFTPTMCMSHYVNAQYEMLGGADSITVDPHKAGYVSYPAGGLCYRNSAMRNLVAFTAPVVYHGGIDPTVGVYGVEGSKPGAAAAGVFLTHRIIPADRSGYGKLLGKCLFNSKRLYAALITMATDQDPFAVTTLQRLPAECAGESPAAIKAQLEYIRTHIVPKSNDELLGDPEAKALFRELGSDQVIIAYAFNFRKNGIVNRDVTLANALNSEVFEKLSLSPDRDEVYNTPMIVTSSTFDPANYGHDFVEAFKKRLGVEGAPETPVDFLISTTMNPWLTDTAEGNFIPTLIGVLRSTVVEAIRSIHPS